MSSQSLSRSPIAVYYVPCKSEAEAQQIARKLLEESLIGCAQVLPAGLSIYMWEGELKEAQESVLILKTTPQAKTLLVKRLKELHTYDCPCFLELEPKSINAEYALWLQGQVKAVASTTAIAPQAKLPELQEKETFDVEDDGLPPWD